MKNKILELVEKTSMKPEPPVFRIGDQVDVHQKILEGEKARVQVFSGTVIAMRGEGTRKMFTVRRIVQGEGVERIFPLHTPRDNHCDSLSTSTSASTPGTHFRD